MRARYMVEEDGGTPMITMSELLKDVDKLPDDGLDKRVVFIDVDDVIFDTTGYLRDLLRGQVSVSEYKKALSDFSKVPMLCEKETLGILDNWFYLKFLFSYSSEEEKISKVAVLRDILQRNDISCYAVERTVKHQIGYADVEHLSISPVIVSNDLTIVRWIWYGVLGTRIYFNQNKSREWNGLYCNNWKDLMFFFKKLK